MTLVGDRMLTQPFSAGKWRQNHLLTEGEEGVGGSGGRLGVSRGSEMEVPGPFLGRVAHVRPQAVSWAGEEV